jgi:basic membrane protein A
VSEPFGLSSGPEREDDVRKGSPTRWSIPAVAALLALAVSACGGDSGSSSGSSTASGGKDTIKIGAALIGPKNDHSFDQAGYEGILAAEKLFPGKVKLTGVLENRTTDQSRADSINTLGPLNDFVLAVSSAFGPVLDVQAPKFPKAYFVDLAGYTKSFHENVTGFANDYGAPLYVAGVIAAHLTKTKVVGFVGGAEIPPTVQGLAGYKAGVASVDPSIKLLSNLVGDFNDVSKAKAGTAAMIAEKADVIFPFVNGGLPGAWAAGTESGKNPAMFSEVTPQCDAYGNMVGTNFVNNKEIVIRLISDYVRGKLKPGTTFLDLQEPTLQTLKLCPKYEANAEIAKATKDTIDGVNSGKIKLPADAMNPRPTYPHREGFDGPVQGGQ